MEYTIQDIIDAAVEQQPSKVQAAFDHLVGQKIVDALEVRKQEIAATMFKAPEEQEVLDQGQEELETEIEAENGEENTISSEEETSQPS